MLSFVLIVTLACPEEPVTITDLDDWKQAYVYAQTSEVRSWLYQDMTNLHVPYYYASTPRCREYWENKANMMQTTYRAWDVLENAIAFSGSEYGADNTEYAIEQLTILRHLIGAPSFYQRQMPWRMD